MTNVVKFPRKRIVREDDYRERMRVNLAALAFIAVFLLVSCWIIDGLLSMPRRDCDSALRSCNVTSGPFSASLGLRDF
jgi:hypothetical protein